MSPVIRPESRAKERKKILRHMSSALNQAGRTLGQADESKDILAFLLMSLERIEDSVGRTISAWEDRGYWVKADRFQLDWAWVGEGRRRLASALTEGDFEAASTAAVQLSARLKDHSPYQSDSEERPWGGCWQRWHQREQGR